jgi:hypothetical protein
LSQFYEFYQACLVGIKYLEEYFMVIISDIQVIKPYKIIISEIIILSDFNKGNNLFK